MEISEVGNSGALHGDGVGGRAGSASEDGREHAVGWDSRLALDEHVGTLANGLVHSVGREGGIDGERRNG